MFTKIIHILYVISFVYFIGGDVHKIFNSHQDLMTKEYILNILMLIFDSIILSFLMIPLSKRKMSVYSVVSDKNIEGIFDNYMDAKLYIDKLKMNNQMKYLIIKNDIYVNKSIFNHDKLKGRQI